MSYARFLTLLTAAAVAGTVLAAPSKPDADPKKEPAKEQGEAKPGVLLTVYNDNFAQPNQPQFYQQPQPGPGMVLIKDRRLLPDELKKGINIVRFTDVAATLEPTSVHFRSLTDPDATVIEQNYEFDLVNADKLLQKYIDQKVTAHTKD